MHVGMICPYSLSVWGGVQAQVMGLSRALRAKGVDVRVLAPTDSVPAESWVVPLGKSIPYAENGSVAPLAPDIPAQLRIVSVLSEFEFDCLHVHEPMAPGPTMTSLIVQPAPIVATYHASGDIKAYKWLRPLLAKAAKRIDVSVAVSEAAAEMVNKHLGVDPILLHNGVEIPDISIPTKPRNVTPVIGFLGRHEPRKGLETLLEATRILEQDLSSSELANLEIAIVGDGPETESLKDKYKGKHHNSSDGEPGPRIELSWLGTITDAEKADFLASIDFLCVPSLGGESFGIVLIEAMASGAHVIASDLEAYAAVANGGSEEATCATLFETGNANALAGVLKDLLVEYPDVSLLERAQLRANEFSMDHLADRYIQLYEQAMA